MDAADRENRAEPQLSLDVADVSVLNVLLADLASEERLCRRGFERLCKWVIENAPESSPVSGFGPVDMSSADASG
jgi:hypothetical protein